VVGGAVGAPTLNVQEVVVIVAIGQNPNSVLVDVQATDPVHLPSDASPFIGRYGTFSCHALDNCHIKRKRAALGWSPPGRPGNYMALSRLPIYPNCSIELTE